MKSVVSEKGQVTIPKALRDRLGIRPGQQLEFNEESGMLVARKSGFESDPVDQLFGILQLDESTDEYISAARGDDED